MNEYMFELYIVSTPN